MIPLARAAVVSFALAVLGCSSSEGGGNGGNGEAGAAGGAAPTGGETAASTSSAGGDGGGHGGDGGHGVDGGHGDGGNGVGRCEERTSSASGGCSVEYTCEGGTVRVICSEDVPEVPATCDCLLDGDIVGNCATPDDNDSSEGAQCQFPDNCCHEVLGAH